MNPILVRLFPEPARTRLRLTRGATTLGTMLLPPAPSVHRRAAPTLLEGLSLFLGERLSVVLCVDARSTSSCEFGLFDPLGAAETSLFYDVGIAARLSRADRRAARALRLSAGDVHDLPPVPAEEAR